MTTWSKEDQAAARQEEWGVWEVVDTDKPDRVYWRIMPTAKEGKIHPTRTSALYSMMVRLSRGSELHQKAMQMIHPANNP